MRSSVKAYAATAAAAVLVMVGLAGAWTITRDSDTSVPKTELEISNVSDQNEQTDDQTEDDYDPGLEEPTIEGDEPQSTREMIEDSRPDSNTVDDGFLATDPEEAVTGEGWTSYGTP